MIQLAWSVSGTIAPVTFAWLLDRGETSLWFAMLALTLVGVGVSALLGRVHAAGGPAGHQRCRRGGRRGPC